MHESKRFEAAAILVGAGVSTYSDHGIDEGEIPRHLCQQAEALGRGLKYRPMEYTAKIKECKAILGVA
jgi:hypothetical protein